VQVAPGWHLQAALPHSQADPQAQDFALMPLADSSAIEFKSGPFAVELI